MGILPKLQAWDPDTTEGQRTVSFSTQPQEMALVPLQPWLQTHSQHPWASCLGASENWGLVLAGHWGTGSLCCLTALQQVLKLMQRRLRYMISIAQSFCWIEERRATTPRDNNIISSTSIQSFLCLSALDNINLKDNHKAEGKAKRRQGRDREESLKLYSRVDLMITGAYRPVWNVFKHGYCTKYIHQLNSQELQLETVRLPRQELSFLPLPLHPWQCKLAALTNQFNTSDHTDWLRRWDIITSETNKMA